MWLGTEEYASVAEDEETDPPPSSSEVCWAGGGGGVWQGTEALAMEDRSLY